MTEVLDIPQLEDLLTTLKKSPSLAPYNLTLYHRKEWEAGDSASFHCCCTRIQDPVSNQVARDFFTRDGVGYLLQLAPGACRYGGAFLGFVVPFSRDGQQFCLMGDGVRDQTIDLWQLAALSRRGSSDVFSLFPHVETLFSTTVQEVEQIAREVAREVARENAGLAPACPTALVQSSHFNQPHLLAEISGFLEQVDQARTLTETIAVCCERLDALAAVSKVAIALRQGNGTWYAVSGIWGLDDNLGAIPAETLGSFLAPGKSKKTVPWSTEMRRVLPALEATLITSFPLDSQGERLGFLALFDTELSSSEIQVIAILAQGVASRMAQLMSQAEHTQASSLSGRLMSLTDTLLHVESKEDLFKTILDIAADLLNASQGSIMLIDKNAETMQIVFTMGLTLNIAQCLPLKVGKGIAGKVALTGQPLLVNDVEKDTRVAMSNRPRFKSKALICIPLKLKEKTIGVLNLSDKADLAPFTDADLQLLTSFANLASLMIERTLVMEESVRFEQLSVTDALTGLYNRRFLKNRLEEELSRSSRHGLSLTILFIDLDFFKSYNDVCGHIAGDEALKRTAEIIQASLREMDIVARYGGEEFCALLPGTTKMEAMIVAERIRSEIQNENFPGERSMPSRRLTASFGVASFPEDGRTFTALVHASDVALYQAKASGRNRIVAAHTAPAQAHKSATAMPPSARPANQQPRPLSPEPKSVDTDAKAPSSETKSAGAAPKTAGTSQPTSTPTLARTFDFNSYLEATEAMRQQR